MPIKSLPPTLMPTAQKTVTHNMVTESKKTPPSPPSRKVLLLRCKDVPGIVARVSGFLADGGFFIHESAQFGETHGQLFFMRVVFSAADDKANTQNCDDLRASFDDIAALYAMDVVIEDLSIKKNMLMLVSRESHCMHHILYRAEAEILPVNVAAVASNHEKLRPIAERYNIPFYYLPVSKDNRAEQEAAIYALVQKYDISLTVLAKYMQILTPALTEKLQGKAINIHHSFLPSFKGGRPYHQAYDRGVKIIGATAHYVSNELDEGPIIEQEVTRVDRPLSPQDMAASGRDIEARVLSRAVKYYLEYRVLMNGSRTVVFN